MTEGQTFHGHNSYRVFFYEEVIEMAQEVNPPTFTINLRDSHTYQVHAILRRQ